MSSSLSFPTIVGVLPGTRAPAVTDLKRVIDTFDPPAVNNTVMIYSDSDVAPCAGVRFPVMYISSRKAPCAATYIAVTELLETSEKAQRL